MFFAAEFTAPFVLAARQTIRQPGRRLKLNRLIDLSDWIDGVGFDYLRYQCIDKPDVLLYSRAIEPFLSPKTWVHLP